MFRIFSNRGGKKNPSTLDRHGRGVEKAQRKKKEKEKKKEGRMVIFWKPAKAAGHEVRRTLATRRAELARWLASQRRCPTERRRISVPRNVERACRRRLFSLLSYPRSPLPLRVRDMWRFPKRFLEDDGWIVGGDHVARIVVKNASLPCASNIVRSLLWGLVHPTDWKGSRSFKSLSKDLYFFYEERGFRFTLIHGCTSFAPNFCQVAMMKRIFRMIIFFWIYSVIIIMKAWAYVSMNSTKWMTTSWEAWFSEILSIFLSRGVNFFGEK